MSNRLLPRLLPAALLFLIATVLAGCGPDLAQRMSTTEWGLCGTVVVVLAIVALVDLLGDATRTFGNKVIWSLVIVLMPVLGVILYFIFGR